MLELLLFAFFTPESDDFFAKQPVNYATEITVSEPASLPFLQLSKKAPKLLDNPDVAIFAMDLDSGKILLEKNPDRVQNIASLTKIMTVLVILDNHEMDEVVTVPRAAVKAGGAGIELYQYEKMTVKTLLEAALIPSANDAAVSLAVHHSETETDFVKVMNEYAQKWGLETAMFYNSTGLDIAGEGSVNLKTGETEVVEPYGNEMAARDVLKLTRIALKNEFFRTTVPKGNFDGTSVDGEFFHEKPTTNQLYGSFLNLSGVKTGYTELAGECFVALGTHDGHQILTVILGSTDRFGETKSFLSWIYDSFEWR